MDQDRLIDVSTQALSGKPGLKALFLGGSFGAGLNDNFSDVDLVAVVEPGNQDILVDIWITEIASLEPIVHEIRRPAGLLLVNLVTKSWHRADLHLRASLEHCGYGRDGLRPLYDPENIHASLPETRVVPDRKARLGAIIGEFIRVLGLLPVGLGRGELVVAASGIFHLQSQLIALFTLQTNAPHPGGALHLSRLINDDQMTLLKTLSFLGFDASDITEANLRYAKVFLPEAREFAASLGVDWPDQFEKATLENLAEHVDRRFAELQQTS